MSDCQLNVEPFYQCCCQCIYHLSVNYHCCTEPKPNPMPPLEEGAARVCVCSVQKGWACVPPGAKTVYDNWPEHSCGCEYYTTKEDLTKDFYHNTLLKKSGAIPIFMVLFIAANVFLVHNIFSDKSRVQHDLKLQKIEQQYYKNHTNEVDQL